MEGSKHQHSHGLAYKGPTETTFLGIDPSNLDNMPRDFYDSEQFLQRSSLSDPQELAHFRTVVATFFNYRVQASIT